MSIIAAVMGRNSIFGSAHVGRQISPSRTALCSLIFRRVAAALAVICLVPAAGLAMFIAPGEGLPAAPSHASTFSESARIKAPTAMIQIGPPPNCGWCMPVYHVNVSFQTESPDGHVVMTVGGSDVVNMDEEGDQLWENPARRAMVDELRGKMRDAGWTELGVDGQWFEYVFGR